MKELAMDGLTGGKHLETWMSGVQTLLNKPSKLKPNVHNIDYNIHKTRPGHPEMMFILKYKTESRAIYNL